MMRKTNKREQQEALVDWFLLITMSVKHSSSGTSSEGTPTYYNTDGEQLSESVRSLLEDDLFKTANNLPNSIRLDKKELMYQQYLSLFVKGKLLESLEKMGKDGLLSDMEDMRIFDLYLTMCAELPTFEKFDVKLLDIAKKNFDGRFEETINNDFYKKNLLTELEFLNKYFNCCIKILRLNHNVDTILFLEEQLKYVISQYTAKIAKLSDNPELMFIILNLQELVKKYIIELEIGFSNSKKSPKLYSKLCSTVPNLSSVLSKYEYANGISYEVHILSQLEDHSVHKNTKSPTNEKDESNTQETKQDDLRAISNDSNATELTDENSIKFLVKQYISRNKFLKYVTENKHTRLVSTYLNNIQIHHYQGLIIAGVLAMFLLRHQLARLKYLLRNIPNSLHSLLPHLIELFRLLSSV